MKDTELSYAVRPRAVAGYLARLGIVLAALSVPPLLVTLLHGETRVAAVLATNIAVLLVVGRLAERRPPPPRIHVNEGLVIAALAFVLAPLLTALPLAASGLPLLDAWFEAVSGITTTGLSTAGSVEGRPASFLFTRAWMQWYGGLGIVSLSLALRMQPGAVARRLSRQSDEHDLVGSTTLYARATLGTYSLLTLVAILVLVAAGLDPWTSLLHAFASVSTGGFSTSDTSLAGLGGPTVRYAVTATCLLGAVPLVVYATLRQAGWRSVFHDQQLRWLAGAAAAVCVATTGLLVLVDGLSWSEALREGPVLGLSAQSTTGFSSRPVAACSDVVQAVILLSMFVGGCAGSTAGGLKVSRLAMLWGVVQHALRRSSMPRHSVSTVRLGGRPVEEQEIHGAVLIFLVALSVVLVSWLAFLACGLPPLASLFEVVSATATVGLSTGLTGPDLPAALKVVLAADMLLGRLEFLALLVLVHPRTWFGRSLEAA